MTDDQTAICWRCRRPVARSKAVRGPRGELYHHGHQPRLKGIHVDP